MNALLRLSHYNEHNAFPEHLELEEYLEAEASEHKVSLEGMAEEGLVASGWRTEFLYRERLGLSPNDMHLIAAPAPAPLVPHAIVGSAFATAWRNYVRSFFRKGFMYQVSLRPESLVYVCVRTRASPVVRTRSTREKPQAGS